MIVIKYSLVEGMSGAGVHIKREVSTGPRNLMAAAEDFDAVRKHLKEAYGNIGCGRVWIEVDGKEVDRHELEKLTKASYAEDMAYIRDCAPSWSSKPLSRTARAKALLLELQGQAE